MPETDNKDRLKELRTQVKSLVDENERISSEFKIEDNGGVVVTPEQRDAFRKNTAEIKEIKGLMEDLSFHPEVKEWINSPEGREASAAARAAAEEKSQITEHKSIGELFVASEEFKALQRSGSSNMQTPWSIKGIDLAGMQTKDVYTGSGGTLTQNTFGRRQREGFIPRAQRTQRVRDLFPAVGTDASLIDYFRVSGFVNNAATVAERTGDNTNFALKPQSALSFEPAQAPVRTIAHFEFAHRNVLNDEPQLRGIIDNELLYGLRLVEDAQVLQGDGLGENILGLLNTPGIQAYTQANDGAATPTPTETKADALRRAATRVILAYYDPTGFVLHPYDWEDVELTKTDQGQYVLATNVAVGAEQRVWRQPVVDSPAIPQGTFLTGAFGLGAQLYDREEGNIRVAEQHADFFIRNAVVILAEERLALTVRRPESFVKGTFVS